ncbi:MAG: YHYH protein [Polyangiales bacterium]
MATPGEGGVPSSRCDVIRTSIAAAGFGNLVDVSCDATYAHVTSDTYPEHELMNGIVGTNEQVPVPAPGHSVPIPLAPRRATSVTSVDGALGVAVNGVPIYDYSAAGELNLGTYDPSVDTKALGQLDHCGGHAGRGDDYHYHAAPTCMMASMANAGDDAILGWAFDGYPIYGDRNPDGTTIAAGELDVCNGRSDSTFGYRYHTSTAPPYILQCLVGAVDTAMLPRVPPLSAQGGMGSRESGTPPAGGVQNLSYVTDASGARTLSYDYQGQHYYLRYTPVAGSNCYAFETKTVTDMGVVKTGTYCR